MNIALIAHDKKKKQLLNFVTAYQPIFKQHTLFATGTTGQQIIDEVSLEVNCLQSGPLGGDQQIGAKIATDDLDLIIFFRDPLTAQPHEPDITALLRLSDVYQIPVATNVATAEIIVRGLSNGWLDWRTIKDSVGEYHD